MTSVRAKDKRHKDCVTVVVEALKSGSEEGSRRLCYSLSGLAVFVRVF